MKSILSAFFFVFISGSLLAQTTAPASKTAPKKTAAKGKKKSGSAKKLKTTGEVEYEEVICYEDGPCTFSILKGDTLVYDVNAAGKQYSLYVIPNKFDAGTIADFNWISGGSDIKSGHVVLGTQALASARKYLTALPAGELKLTDASAIWLSNVNFKEITKGQSSLALDNDAAETFSSPETDAVTLPINYKATTLTLDGFAVQDKPEGQTGRKEIWILNISNNLLLIKVDNGGNFSMQLKEVREKKAKAAAPAKKK